MKSNFTLIILFVFSLNFALNIGVIDNNELNTSRDDIIPPTNLIKLVDDNNITLSWTAPNANEGITDWMNWYSGIMYNGVGNISDPCDFDVAARFEPADLADFDGSILTKIKMMPKESHADFYLKIWMGGSEFDAGNLVYEQYLENPVAGIWNEVVLQEPIVIDVTQELWIGYRVVADYGTPAGIDYGPAIAGKGDLITEPGYWVSMSDHYNIDYNFMIAGYAQGAEGEQILSKKEYIDESNQNNVYRNPDRDFLGYKIYRNENEIGLVDSETNYFHDNDLPVGIFNYYVTALYDDGESEPSNIVEVVILPDDFYPINEDFEDGIPEEWTIVDNDGDGHNWFPSEMWAGYESSTCATSKSYDYDDEELSPDNWLITPSFYVEEGRDYNLQYYVGTRYNQWFEEHYALRVSTTDTALESFDIILLEETLTSGDWVEKNIDLTQFEGETIYLAWQHYESYDQYCINIDNVIVIPSLENDDVNQINNFKLDNYPNPFNPETTFSFSVPYSSNVELTLYNLLGQKVIDITNNFYNTGDYKINWKGNDTSGNIVSSGIYFCSLKLDGKVVSTKKCVLMK